MSQIYRLFGMQFSPARFELKLEGYDQTGFEVGCAIGFDRIGKSASERNIFTQLGIDPQSDAAIEFEDEIKYGAPELSDFVRDVLAGYEHAKAHMKMASEACLKLSHCVYYLSRHRADVQIDFPAEALEKFSKTEFMVKQVDETVMKSSEVFKHPCHISNGKLLVGPDQVQFAVDPEMAYDQEACRAIHNYVGSIVENLYILMEEVMATEQRESVIRKIRQDVEGKVKTAFGDDCDPVALPEIPNFYLSDK